MFDQETKKEVVNDILLHYGVKGMKWDKKKEKLVEETRRKSDLVLDMRGKDATRENILKEEAKILKRNAKKGTKKESEFDKALQEGKRDQQKNKYEKRKEYEHVAQTMRDYSKTKEVKKKNDSLIEKVKEKIQGKDMKDLGSYLDKRFQGKNSEKSRMITKMINQASKSRKPKPKNKSLKK